MKNNERHGWQLELKDCQNVSRQTSIKRSASDSVTLDVFFLETITNLEPVDRIRSVVVSPLTTDDFHGLLYPVVNHNPIFHWYDPGSKCEVDEVANDLPIS